MEKTPQPHSDSRVTGRVKIIVGILLFLAAAEFTIRGPMRFVLAPTSWNDLSQNYTASRLWLKGQNPSDPRNFVALWKVEGRSRLALTDIRVHVAPPPGTLVLMAPIAVFPWSVAKFIWLAVLLAAFGLTLWTLALTGGFRDDPVRTLLFVAGGLALAPFHTGMANGNWTLLVVGACAVGIWAAHNRREVTAGLLFAVGCSLKPQIGALFVLYYLVRQRWRLFVTAVAGTIGLASIAVLRLEISGVSWMQDYIHNASGFFSSNHIDDFTSANPIRFTLINLQVPFFSITGRSSWANLLAVSTGTVLMLCCFYWVMRNRLDGSELLPLGTIAVIGLMPVYHRFYDASLLVVPLCWCVAEGIERSRRTVLFVLLLMTPFLIPGTVVLQELDMQKRIPAAVTNSWWWNCIVMPHETWVLLLLSLVLLGEMMRSSTRASQVPPVLVDESGR